MNARRASSDEPKDGSSSGRVLLIGAVLFALAATGALVLTDEQKWLRLGIIAALWAALVGAFLAAKYRRQLADQEEVAADRQEIYELELEREVAARREYELEVAADARRQAEENSRDDIAALREELSTLRHTLESLLGGEFLVERYALRAESTRMRSLREDRSLAMHNNLKRLPAAQPKDDDVVPPLVREAETDLIERVREVHRAPRREPPPSHPPQRVEPRPESRPSLPRRAERAARAEWPTPEPVTPVPRAEPVAPVTRAPYAEPVTPAPRAEPVAPVTRDEPVAPARQERWEHPPHPAEVSDRWFIPGALESELPAAKTVDEEEWAPSWASGRHAGANGHDPEVPFGHHAEQTNWLAQYNNPEPTVPQEPSYANRAYVRPAAHAERHRAEPESSRRRHARAEPPEPQQSGGGRRRRAEGQPSWQDSVAWREDGGRGGRNRSHARPEPADDRPSGSHAAGRSVNELLASHGIEASPRRRRRRED